MRASGSGRRELWVWVCAAVLGSLLILFAAGREWVVGARSVGELGAPGDGVLMPTGSELSPALTPIALAALAGVVAVLATKGVGRRLIGGLIALCGLAAGITAFRAVDDATVVAALPEGLGEVAWDTTIWPYVAVAGAVLIAAAGVVAIVRGKQWSAMSGRYDRPGPGQERPADDRSLWDALDRGDDPTSDKKEP